jgi:hypothetical protein
MSPVIDFRALLLKALAELEDGLFAEDRISRELAILYRIAAHHGLASFFRSKVREARRNKRRPLEGNAVSPSRIYLNADNLGIQNVFDASYFAYYAHAVASTLTASTAWQAVVNSARYRILSWRKGPRFPEESTWVTE